MPAADDLLADPSADEVTLRSMATNNEKPAYTLWLHWLVELLPLVQGAALLRVAPISGRPLSLVRSTDSCTLPKALLTLGSQACIHGCKQRLFSKSSGKQLLAIPLTESKEGQAATMALLLVSAKLDKEQQQLLLGLASWAMKSLLWLDVSTKPGSNRRGAFSMQASQEPVRAQRLLDQLAEHYEGAQCALVKINRHRRLPCKAEVLLISGQVRFDVKSAVVRQLATFVERKYPLMQSDLAPFYELGEGSDDAFVHDRCVSNDVLLSFLLPIPLHGELYVFSLQRSAQQTLSLQQREDLGTKQLPALQLALLLMQAESPLSTVLGRLMLDWKKSLLRPLWRRSIQIAALSLLVAYLLIPVEKRVSSEFVIEATERHALIAPVDGIVKSVQARAGDWVEQGMLLATLDDEELQRQADKWLAEEQKNEHDYQSALALHDRVELSSLRKNSALIQAELSQVQAQLARLELRAPMEGVVLSDDVEDALGAAVKAGSVLFELGSAEQHRLALQVSERKIDAIKIGQTMVVRMTAAPGSSRQASVDTIVPLANDVQGQNTFKVYALPEGHTEFLRPGMKGIAKVLVGRESRLSQWLSSFWSRCIWLAWKLGLIG